MCSYATKKYIAGDVIASSQPFVHVVYPAFKSKFCDHCFAQNSALKKCSKCHFMYYCDRNCQTIDWKLHKLECKIFVKHIDAIKQNLTDLTEDVLIYVRATLVIKNFPEMSTLKYDLHDGHQRCFFDLMSHEKEIKRDVSRNDYIMKLFTLFNRCDISVTFNQLCAIVGRLQTNNLGLKGFESDRICLDRYIGGALYIPLSVFNHSCVPNAIYVNSGTRMEIRAVNQIEPNEEITITYIDFGKPKIERQLELRQYYYFVCHCVKCDTNSDQNFDYKHKELCSNLDDELPLIFFANKTPNQSKIVSCIKLEEKLLDLEKQLGHHYSPYNSQLMFSHSMMLMTSFVSNCSVCSMSDIQSFIKSTEHNIKITHGINHRFFKIFEKSLKKLMDLKSI